MGMTKEDCAWLSQIVGGIKRATTTVKNAAAQIASLSCRYEGTDPEQFNDAGIRCLFQARYWLEQATETLAYLVKKSRESLGGVK